MEAYLDPADPQHGSAPGNVLSKTMEALEKAGYLQMVRGHLLNDNLGGPGIACNLFPITAAANHLHLLNAENHIKQYLSNKNVGVMYCVEVTEANYTIDDPSCCFTCEAYPWYVATSYVDKSNPVLYPIDIKSVPIKKRWGKKKEKLYLFQKELIHLESNMIIPQIIGLLLYCFTIHNYHLVGEV